MQPAREEAEEETPDYPVHLFFTREGYFKKITPQSLRMSSEQKLKEGDEILSEIESTNRAHLLFFTDRQQVYKSHAYDFDDTKASVMGDYVPAKLSFDEGERIVCFAAVQEYTGYMLFFFPVSYTHLDVYKRQEQKIPPRQRSRIPILSDERSPVWVYGLGVDKRVLPTEETTRFLVIDIEEEAL